MGNQPTTTRRVTFEREQTGLIAISDSVAKRLRSGDSAPSSRAVSAESAHSRAPETSPAKSPTSLGSRSDTPISQSSSEYDDLHNVEQYQIRHRPVQYIAQPAPPSDDHHQALSKLEAQWQERYKRLESDTEFVKKTSADELQRALKHVESLFEFKSHNVGHTELQHAVLECYKQNTTRTLNCSREVDAFIRGIEDYKTGFLGKQLS